MKKLINFSITKDCVILSYFKDGKEINAIIPPYLFCTYLVDLNVIQDRFDAIGQLPLIITYKDDEDYLNWRDFIIQSQNERIYTSALLEAIIERHEETELLKSVFDVKGNANFSMN